MVPHSKLTNCEEREDEQGKVYPALEPDTETEIEQPIGKKEKFRLADSPEEKKRWKKKIMKGYWRMM